MDNIEDILTEIDEHLDRQRSPQRPIENTRVLHPRSRSVVVDQRTFDERIVEYAKTLLSNGLVIIRLFDSSEMEEMNNLVSSVVPYDANAPRSPSSIAAHHDKIVRVTYERIINKLKEFFVVLANSTEYMYLRHVYGCVKRNKDLIDAEPCIHMDTTLHQFDGWLTLNGTHTVEYVPRHSPAGTHEIAKTHPGDLLLKYTDGNVKRSPLDIHPSSGVSIEYGFAMSNSPHSASDSYLNAQLVAYHKMRLPRRANGTRAPGGNVLVAGKSKTSVLPFPSSESRAIVRTSVSTSKTTETEDTWTIEELKRMLYHIHTV
jgi:hypothetical protein